MSNSRSFDRAAHIYDQTRLLNESIAKYGIPAIMDILGANARLLEVGAGTGRISIPLLERGADLIGCDLSSQMLARFQEKFAPAPIVQADAVFLPFASNQFEAVMTVHVLHLIPVWREALHEFKRVLEPGNERGELMNALNERIAGDERVESVLLGLHDGLTIARKS